MTVIVHVVDPAATEADLSALHTLLDRLPGESHRQIVVAAASRAAARLAERLGRPVLRTDGRFGPLLPGSLSLRHFVRAHDAHIMHAWGLGAAAAAASAAAGRPMVVCGIQPHETLRAARRLRPLSSPPAVVTSSHTVRSRLAASGVSGEHSVVIRPPVDFAALNRARREVLRRRLLGDARPVLLTPGPARRGDGQFQAVWAAGVLQRIHPDLRIVVPFESAETARLRRFAASFRRPEMLFCPGDSLRWPELVTLADVLVIAPDAEIACEPIAWAMAAGVPVAGAARRSVAEFIADRQNGLLCRENAPRLLAAAVLRLLEDEPLRRRLVETARGQAFEVFGARAFVDNYAALYENLRAGRKPAHGVRDTAAA